LELNGTVVSDPSERVDIRIDVKFLLTTSCIMSSFAYNDREVYDAKDVKEMYPDFFLGCADSIKRVVSLRKIPSDVISYGIRTRSGWNESTAAIRKSTLLLDKEWVDNNIATLLKKGVTNAAGRTYLPAPDILEMADDEKLCDDEGNIYEIEVRGERSVDKCYFKASDVETALKMKNITGTIQRTSSEHDDVVYEYGKHYQTFIANTTSIDGTAGYRHSIIYLTYWGFVQLLMTRRHPIAIKFQRWAVKTLFTVRHGTPETKQELAGELLGTNVDSIKSFLATDTSTVSAIYLFIIGRIGDLRDEMKIDVKRRFDDNGLVAKFGYTADLRRRTLEHSKTFNKFKGANIYLRCHARVDPKFLSEAEKDLSGFFETEECLVTDNKKYEELVILNKKYIKSTVFDKFKSIGVIYEGRYADVKILQLQLQQLNEAIATKDIMLAEKERIIAEVSYGKERIISEKEKVYTMMIKYIDDKDARIIELNEHIAEQNVIIQQLHERINSLKEHI